VEKDSKKNQSIAENWRELLSPQGHLIAIKFLKSTDGMEEVKRPERPVTLCQLLSQVRYLGRTRIDEHDGCYGANWFLGFELQTEEDRIAMAKRYSGWQKLNEEAARGTTDKIRLLPFGEYKAILVAPLERCPVTPDVLVFFGNASQMLVIVASYLWNRGEVLTFTASGFAACANVVALPMIDKKPQITIPGNAMKLLALPNNDDLVCGTPGELLEEMTENMRLLRERGGSRYPPAWHHIRWEPPPPIGDLLKSTGKATWVKS
jgi:uncharacterized protein (DUF169 family)